MANNAAITDGRNLTGHLPAVLTVTASLPLSAASSACQGQQGPDAAVRVRAQDTVCAACGRGTHSSREGQAAGTVATQTTHLSQHSSARWTGQGTGQGSGRKPCPACYLGRMREERTAEKNKTEGQAEPWVHQRRGGHVRGAGADGDTYEVEGGGEGGGSSSSVAVIRCARAAHQGSTGGSARAEPTRDKPVQRRVCAAWRRGCPEREEAASAQKSDAAPPTLVTLVGRKRVRARCTGECRPQHDKGAQIVWKRDVPALPGRRPGAGRHAA